MKKEEDELPKERKKVKIGVFGVGAVGSIIISFLQQYEEVSEIIAIDYNSKRAKNFIGHWDKLRLVISDSNGYEKLIKKLAGCFLLINAASSQLNRWIMKIALVIKANYLDLASLENDMAEQKSFSDRFKKEEIVAWINWGIGPGLTNILAAKLIEGLNDCIIKIWVAEHTDCDQLIFLWNPKLVIDEITSEVAAFSKNPLHAKQIKKPFSGPEFYIFPEPIGKIICYNMNENEGLTLQALKNVREIQVKSGGSDIERLASFSARIKKYQQVKRLEKFLNSLPETPTPQQVKELIKKGTLRQGLIDLAVEVEGYDPATNERQSRKAVWCGLSLSEVPQGTTHMNFNTGLIAFCAIKQMLISEKLLPGVWAPEELSQKNRSAIIKAIAEKSHPINFQMA